VGGGVGLALAGLGIGGLIGALVVRQNALGTIEDQCGKSLTNCDPSLEDERDRGVTASALVTGFAIGAGVAGAAGLGLLIAGLVTGPKADAKQTSTFRIDFAPGPSGVFAGLTTSL